MLIIEKETALDVNIKGSVGHFQVGSSSGESVRVQYLQTHVKFAVSGEAEEKLLHNLKPVREVFEISDLEFDEIIQRDIDDGRVSTELIPYLLHDQSQVLVKLFPPIIAVVLPTNSASKPADYYPTTSTFDEEDGKNNSINWRITRSGELGAEAFEFRQLLQDNEPQEHDYAQLKINSTKCRLAIVDGQHRAMALLALYRNMKGWPDTSMKNIEEYYKRWSPSELDQYDLTKIRLPVMLITFPDLDGSDASNPKVKEACRSVFLALNKNAKPVSSARNYLLDDSDIIATLLRSTLRVIKNYDHTAKQRIRMWNVELDSDGNQRKLDSTVAITGIMHLYGTIELLLLNQHAPASDKLTHPTQRLASKRDLVDFCKRLNLRDSLGEDVVKSISRYYFDQKHVATVEAEFMGSFGESIIELLDKLTPYRAISEASLLLEKQLMSDSNGATYRAILFEGQGQGHVFESYVEQLTTIRDGFQKSDKAVPPQLEASYSSFEDKAKELNRLKSQFKEMRNSQYLGIAVEKCKPFSEALNDLFSNTFTTEAFQRALLMTFWSAIESVSDEEPFTKTETAKALEHYISSLNSFFDISTNKTKRKKVLGTFYGEEVVAESKEPQINRSTSTFKKIVIPAELKPDEWPRFRYILLEIWLAHGEQNFTNGKIQDYVKSHCSTLRDAALSGYEERQLKLEAEKNGMLNSDLDSETVKAIAKDCKNTFDKALNKLKA